MYYDKTHLPGTWQAVFKILYSYPRLSEWKYFVTSSTLVFKNKNKKQKQTNKQKKHTQKKQHTNKNKKNPN